MTLRVAERDQQVGPYTVPAGTWLQVNLLAIHRDRALWGADADCYVPERFVDGTPEAARRPKDAFFPFGDAALRCVGAAFAQREAHVTLARLFGQFEFALVGGCGKGGDGAAAAAFELDCKLTLAPRGGVLVLPVERKKKKGEKKAAVAADDADSDAASSVDAPATPPATEGGVTAGAA